MTSLLVLATQNEAHVYLAASQRAKSRHLNRNPPIDSEGALSMQTLRVSEYVIQLLHGDTVSLQLRRSLTSTAYLALLPTVWALINTTASSHQEMSVSVLEATLEHAFKTPSKSALKKHTIGFVARIVLVSGVPFSHHLIFF